MKNREKHLHEYRKAEVERQGDRISSSLRSLEPKSGTRSSTNGIIESVAIGLKPEKGNWSYDEEYARDFKRENKWRKPAWEKPGITPSEWESFAHSLEYWESVTMVLLETKAGVS